MSKFLEPIRVEYPPNNRQIFEEWFFGKYIGCDTDRELIPAFFTSYWVNNDYGKDAAAKQAMQSFIDSLDRNKKWFTIIQYDDGALIDFKDLDVLQFNMSKKIGVEIPLMCQPHPYTFDNKRNLLYSFVGSNTHPIRTRMKNAPSNQGAMIFNNLPIETYCRYLSESFFGLCPRGYGLSSFRIAECMQYGAIPVYISDSHVIPFGVDFSDFGVLISENDVDRWHEILLNISPQEIINKQDNIKKYYEKYYTYEGCFNQIVKRLEAEYNIGKES